ncbi:GntR family transcriptional regulator [Cupriavidus sp. IDO]|uniref:GntR family transcriptional regulator n=1 Tax=Cupriavidus sp. IDO TaxID=1539142 RepID=UPI00068CC48A|nr:GntR family transcriptional regulator [Cupriavidus sp. IDO]KWR90748.1 GntR family transcriptional regulator [Cupriavidus sp. IDO]
MKNDSSRSVADPSAAQTTRYLELASSLVKDIVEGRYVTGCLLPTEPDLARQYGVSRHTVRSALDVPQERGYISRKKSVGTRVESANPSVSYSQSFGTIDDLVRVAATEVRSVQSVREVTLDRAMARRLEAPVGSKWVCLSGVRVDVRKGNSPVSWAGIYIDTAFAHITKQVEENPQTLVSALIERECGQTIAEIRQTISGALVDEPMAKVLKADAGSAGLRLLRHYKDEKGRILEMTETLYPADRVSVSLHLKRGKGAA